MALIPTLLALLVGVVLGRRWGGDLRNVAEWRPEAWTALAGGLGVLVLVDLVGIRGGAVTLMVLAARAAIVWFAVRNVRVGGMVLVVAGAGLNLFVSVLNLGMPVSGSALVRSGAVDAAVLDQVELNGGRVLADGATLGVLGGVIPLPWGQVVSVGDVVTLVGVTLVTASVMRRYRVGGPQRRRSAAPVGAGRRRNGPGDYRDALEALGRGPAPRRGPGLHPSRLPGAATGAGRGGPRPRPRRRPGTRPR